MALLTDPPMGMLNSERRNLYEDNLESIACCKAISYAL